MCTHNNYCEQTNSWHNSCHTVPFAHLTLSVTKHLLRRRYMFPCDILCHLLYCPAECNFVKSTPAIPSGGTDAHSAVQSFKLTESEAGLFTLSPSTAPPHTLNCMRSSREKLVATSASEDDSPGIATRSQPAWRSGNRRNRTQDGRSGSWGGPHDEAAAAGSGSALDEWDEAELAHLSPDSQKRERRRIANRACARRIRQRKTVS
jgi:hypothetical protein